MKMEAEIQSRPESLNHRHCATQRVIDPLPPCAATLPGKKGAQEQPQRKAYQLGSPSQQKPQPFGKREDPLAHGHRRQNAVPKMRRSIGHAPGRTRRTHTAIFARESDEQLVAASRTADAGEAVAENAAAQISLKFGADEGGDVAAGIALGRVGQKRGEVFPDNAVEQRLFRLSTLVAERRSGRAACFRPGFRCRSEHRSVPITSHANLGLRRQTMELDGDRS